MLIRGFNYGGGGGGGGAGSNGPANAIQTSDGAGGFVGEAAFTYDPATNTVILNSGTQVADNPALNISQTWNNAAVAFTGLKFNVTDTASNAASLLANFQVGGVSRFSVDRSGQVGASVVGVEGGIELTKLNIRYDDFRVALNGQSWLFISAGAITLDSRLAYGWSPGNASVGRDLTLFRDAANTLAQRNGTNAQAFRVYNTYTDASNYERGFMRWSSNVLEVGTEAAGSGTNRAIRIRSGSNSLELRNSDGLQANFGAGTNQIHFYRALIFAVNGGGTIGGNGAINGSQAGLTVTGGNVGSGQNGLSYLNLYGGNASPNSATHIVGGAVNILAGNGSSGSAGAAHGGHVYLDGGQGYGTGNHGNIIVGNTRGKLQLTPTTVGSLGSASPAGQRTFVTDATATTFHSIVSGGGANFVPVFSDGTDWRIG